MARVATPVTGHSTHTCRRQFLLPHFSGLLVLLQGSERSLFFLHAALAQKQRRALSSPRSMQPTRHPSGSRAQKKRHTHPVFLTAAFVPQLHERVQRTGGFQLGRTTNTLPLRCLSTFGIQLERVGGWLAVRSLSLLCASLCALQSPIIIRRQSCFGLCDSLN